MHETVTIVNTPAAAAHITPRQFTLAIVESVVARHPGVTVQDVLGPCRLRKVSMARRDAIVELHLARPHWSYPMLAKEMGGLDHTSVMYALKMAGVWRPGKTEDARRERDLDLARRHDPRFNFLGEGI